MKQCDLNLKNNDNKTELWIYLDSDHESKIEYLDMEKWGKGHKLK